MMYSKIAEQIPPSPIRDMMCRAELYEDVISFAVGEPDFYPTENIIEATKTSLDNHEVRYAPGAGLLELREKYADYLTKSTGIEYDMSEVIVTTGGMGALFLGMLSVIDPGDEVLISAPYFSNYAQTVSLCHGKTVTVEVREKDNFVLTPEAVQKAITPKSKVLIINSPCNPTGSLISYDILKKIAEIAIKNDLLVISDEVYSHIVFDGQLYHSIVEFPGMKERTLIVDSCSKTFAMTGFRVGFAAGPEHLISLMTKLTEGVYSAGVTFSQRAAVEAFNSGMDHCEEMCREYEQRRNYICRELDKIDGISCIKPEGAFYVFVNISQSGMDAKHFSDHLLDEEHVAVVPGDNFGSAEGYKYIRISYATSMDNIIEGIKRISNFCSEYIAI